MIHLRSIELSNFKGVSRLVCDFDDLTVLAGLNNSGKTTILQAVYLLMAALPKVARHQQLNSPQKSARVISLNDALSPLGLRDTNWLTSMIAPDVEGVVIGSFANGVRLELGIIRDQPSQCVFSISDLRTGEQPEDAEMFLKDISKLSGMILTPPGEVPSREDMVNGVQYQTMLREGKGSQLWRNSIWWGIQTDGFESFAPVQRQITKYFPDVELLLPTLSPREHQPEILIRYREKGRGLLDIAQSGAGLRTFVSLARILEQSSSQVVLLDEPDAHLHASQQAIIVDLMLDVALSSERQVIIASHAPEIISRVPSECLRWVDRLSESARGGEELGKMLERLGVSPGVHLPRLRLPEVLVYVEGDTDRPVLEALIRWCRAHNDQSLPTSIVIAHKDGRFEGPTLQGIARFLSEAGCAGRVVGVRDLDWYYGELPAEICEVNDGRGWSLVTLSCKEMENLFCDPDLLCDAYEKKLPRDYFERVLDEESNEKELIEEWRFQVMDRVRQRLPRELDPSTKEKKAATKFESWAANPVIRRRLVAGKGLLRRVRSRVRREHSLNFYPVRVFESLVQLPQAISIVAEQIFPELRTNAQSAIPSE